MPRPDHPARPVRRRLLAPIASLLTAAGVCAVLAALIGTATPAAAAADLPIRHSSPILPFPTPPGGGASSADAGTSAPAVTQSSPKAAASRGEGGKGGANSIYSATFTPQTLPTQPPPTSAGPCTPDTKAPTSGAELELPQIAGDSTDSGYQGWLPVKTVGPSAMLPPQLASANLTTLTLTRAVDPESANLSMAASSGTRFSCALLDVAAGDGYQRIDYALTNAGFISEIQKGSTEYLTVTYARISWNYVASAGAGAQTGSGAVNTKPDQQQASVRHGAELVVAGVLGLALVCALGLLGLTLVGRHRRKVRYRQVRERSRQVAVQQARTQIPARVPARGVRQRVTAMAGGVSSGEPELPVPEELREVKVTQFSHSAAIDETAATVVAAEEKVLHEDAADEDAPEAELAEEDAAKEDAAEAEEVEEVDESDSEPEAVAVAEADELDEAESDGAGPDEIESEEDVAEAEANEAENSGDSVESDSEGADVGEEPSDEASPSEEPSDVVEESTEENLDAPVAESASVEPAEPADADATAESDSDQADSPEDAAEDVAEDVADDSAEDVADDVAEDSDPDAVDADETSPADA